MAIKSLVSSAWEEVEDLKVPVSGAYETADHANALVDSAWEEVWSASKYAFNTIATHYNTKYVSDGTISATISWNNYSETTVTFWIDGDFIAGQSYTLSFDYTTIYFPSGSAYCTLSCGSATSSRASFTSSTTSGGSISATVTPTKDATILGVTITGGGASSGGGNVTLSNIAINGSIVKLAA